MSCLSMLPNLGPISTLYVKFDVMSPAEVHLLAGLQLHRLALACWSGFCLGALPAA